MNFDKLGYVVSHQREIFAPLQFLAEWRRQEQKHRENARTRDEHHGHVAEQLRAWQLASVLVLTAGCAGTSELRHQANPQWYANQLVQLDWIEDQDENRPVSPSREAAPSDNQRQSRQLAETNNVAAKPGAAAVRNSDASAILPTSREDVGEPVNDGHRALGIAGGRPYERSVYGAGSCAAGTAMGFSAPLCN